MAMSTAFRSLSEALSTWKLRAGALVLLFCVAAAPTARAQRYVREPGFNRDRAVIGNLVSVEVRVDGHWAPLYHTPGQWDRRYLEAMRGHDYSLRIRNRTGRRIGVLIAVDGLNVVSGERSGLSPAEPMYVLDPWRSATIRGWRTSLDEVRRFVFVDEERSYASRTDQANGDMGWIRVLAFEEVPQVVSRLGVDSDQLDTSTAPEAPAPQARPESGDAHKAAPQPLEGRERAEQSFPGTGWGDRSRDRVREVWFEPMATATDQLFLRYEYASGLRALGIFPEAARLELRERGEFGFAQPPRW
jgi:hypothetical protein